MDTLVERQVELPDPKRSGGSIVWKLSARGLEWEGGQSRAAWMPFACMRRITLGSVDKLGGWRMRIEGPPGSVLIGSSHRGAHESPDASQRFTVLASDIIRESAQRGCPPKFRLNNNRIILEVLWTWSGSVVNDPETLLTQLDVSPK